MFSSNIGRGRSNQADRQSARSSVRGLVQVFAPLHRTAINFIQQLAAPIRAAVSRFTNQKASIAPRRSPGSPTTQPASTSRDRLRQALNLFLSITQFAAAALIFSSEFGDELFRNPASREPLIVPADYTFAIWSFIFPASIVYGVYQVLPRQRTNDLLRRIGLHTAFAFGCITLWSVATLFDPLRYTVPLFFGALAGLVYAVYQSSRHPRPLTYTERRLVVVPLGVYAAWCTVGTIANTSTSLFGLGYTDPIFSEQTWALIMLLAAGGISAWMTIASRGNIPYAVGIIWALIGIVVATVTERPNGAVAITAGAMAALVCLALVYVRATTMQAAESRQE